jgi:hypothetical protein
MTLGQALLYAFALYAAVGLGFGATFVAVGVSKVLPEPASFTLGARLLLLPAAAALWPYVLMRWLKARGAR